MSEQESESSVSGLVAAMWAFVGFCIATFLFAALMQLASLDLKASREETRGAKRDAAQWHDMYCKVALRNSPTGADSIRVFQGEKSCLPGWTDWGQ